MPGRERHRPTRRRIRGITLSDSLDLRRWTPLDEKAAQEGESLHYTGRLNRRWYEFDGSDLAEIQSILNPEPEQEDEITKCFVKDFNPFHETLTPEFSA
jgi:hypothetical protein